MPRRQAAPHNVLSTRITPGAKQCRLGSGYGDIIAAKELEHIK
jgi:hypothetical protein